MKGQNIPPLIIYLFHISTILWGFTEQEEVIGLFSKDCILPCRFPPGHDEVIHWSKENKNVHSYYQQKDQLEEQDPHYRLRTHLFHENIPSGNASLKLSNLTMTDEGSYTCYVGTVQDGTEVEVLLRVRAPSSYALEYQKTKTERRLKCYVFLTYPAPNISWVKGNISIQETDREETRNGVLYSLRSDQDIINMADTYYCHIHFHGEVWAAEWKMQDHLFNVEGGSTVIPCEHRNDTESSGFDSGFSVVWTLHRNAVSSVLASFNGTSHSHQPRVRVHENDFSLMLDDLTADDSGEYLCNISTPFYTKLTVRTLHVENSGKTWKIVLGALFVAVVTTVATVVAVCYLKEILRTIWSLTSSLCTALLFTGARYLQVDAFYSHVFVIGWLCIRIFCLFPLQWKKKGRKESYEHLDIQEESSFLHRDTTEIVDEKNKEFLHLLL